MTPQGTWSISQGEGAEQHWGFEQEILPWLLLALAQYSEADHGGGSGLGHCRRTNAGVAV